MSDKDHDARFLDHARSALDREANSLDNETALRLKQARRSALEQLDTQRIQWWPTLRLPAMAVATGIIVAIVLTLTFRSPVEMQDRHVLADLEILASDENLDMLDDMDFYYWLAETEKNAG